MKPKAPCGHPGTYVTANFISCDLRCEFKEQNKKSDGVPKPIDPEKTQPLCQHCGSDNLEEYRGMVDDDGKQLYHCHDCEFASLL